MADGVGRVPFAAEVNALDAEVRGEERVVAGGGTEHSAVVANAVHDASCGGLGRSCVVAYAATDSGDEFLLSDGQSGTTIKEQAGKCLPGVRLKSAAQCYAGCNGPYGHLLVGN